MKSDWIDISVPVSKETPVWPGDPSPQLTTLFSQENGDDYRLSELRFGLHTGTHIDAPLHFIREGKDVAALELWRMVGEVQVVDATAVQSITAAYLETLPIGSANRLLFKTFSGSEPRSMAARRQPFRALDNSAAEWLAKRGIVLCGIDGMTIAIEEELSAVHRILLEKETVIVENLFLEQLTAGLYEMMALPVLIPGAEAAPARVLIKKSRSYDRD